MGGGNGGLGATTETTKEGGGGRGGVKGGRGGKGSRGLRKKGGEHHEAWGSPVVYHAVLDVLRILPLQFVYKGAEKLEGGVLDQEGHRLMTLVSNQNSPINIRFGLANQPICSISDLAGSAACACKPQSMK